MGACLSFMPTADSLRRTLALTCRWELAFFPSTMVLQLGGATDVTVGHRPDLSGQPAGSMLAGARGSERERGRERTELGGGGRGGFLQKPSAAPASRHCGAGSLLMHKTPWALYRERSGPSQGGY